MGLRRTELPYMNFPGMVQVLSDQELGGSRVCLGKDLCYKRGHDLLANKQARKSASIDLCLTLSNVTLWLRVYVSDPAF
jgi:hypothetical protein